MCFTGPRERRESTPKVSVRHPDRRHPVESRTSMAKVFISFVHEDRTVAEAVKALIEHDLKLRGQVFMVTDQSQLRAGDDWLKKIHDELTSADVVPVMLSKRSITKPWVNFEAGAAWLA